MIDVPMKIGVPLDRNSITSINQQKVQGPQNYQTISSINRSGGAATGHNPVVGHNQTTGHITGAPVTPTAAPVTPSAVPNAMPAVTNKPIPPLVKTTQKGQKVVLEGINQQSKVKVCLGWNVNNPQCDVDVSAFLLNNTGKVIGDDWFVFYGQPQSPDNSVVFNEDNGADREFITIDFSKLNNNVTKIVFVLTINEAFEKNLNFSMLKDAYIRVMDMSCSTEYISFKMTDYYSNVASMMIGEIYLHNNNWKFNAIGNGVAKDLAGLCELYGVQTV